MLLLYYEPLWLSDSSYFNSSASSAAVFLTCCVFILWSEILFTFKREFRVEELDSFSSANLTIWVDVSWEFWDALETPRSRMISVAIELEVSILLMSELNEEVIPLCSSCSSNTSCWWSDPPLYLNTFFTKLSFPPLGCKEPSSSLFIMPPSLSSYSVLFFSESSIIWIGEISYLLASQSRYPNYPSLFPLDDLQDSYAAPLKHFQFIEMNFID